MNTTPVQVRPARLEDAEIIAAFNTAIARETENKTLRPETVRAGVERVLTDASLGRYYVAECDGRVVGQCMITYEWSDWRCGTFWWIQSVYTHPEYRGRGVFRTLYRAIEQAARQTPDVCGLRLYVEAHNERAIETYRRLGMTPSGHVLYEADWSA